LDPALDFFPSLNAAAQNSEHAGIPRATEAHHVVLDNGSGLGIFSGALKGYEFHAAF
jgi:hypothetical protein